jgi:RNA polymerase sigma-70 factor (ECF subfamily)
LTLPPDLQLNRIARPTAPRREVLDQQGIRRHRFVCLDYNPTAAPEAGIVNRDEVQRLLGSLRGAEAAVVRMYHLEGKSFREISVAVGMPENSIGPTLSRARAKMRQALSDLPSA